MTVRQEKLKKELFRVIKEVLTYDISNPLVIGIEITSLDISRDLSHCIVYYVKKNPSEELETSLIKMSSFIKGKISRRLKLRKIPNLIFKYDSRPEYIEKIDKILGGIEYSNQDEERLMGMYKKLEDEFK